jgi:hypothetical protein
MSKSAGFPVASYPALSTVTDTLANIAPALGNVPNIYVWLVDESTGIVYGPSAKTDSGGNWSLAPIPQGIYQTFYAGESPTGVAPTRWTTAGVKGYLVSIAINPPFGWAATVPAVNNAIVPEWRVSTTGVAQAGKFANLFVSQTYNSVLETYMSLGYNPQQETAGEIGSWLSWLPNCADTSSLQFQSSVAFSDGQTLKAFLMLAKLDTTHSISWQFTVGKGSLDYFLLQDGFNAPLLSVYPEANAAGSYFSFQARLIQFASPAGHDLGVRFQPPSGQNWFLNFYNGGVNNWQLTSNVLNNLYLWDVVNGVNSLIMTPGAGNNGKFSLASVFYPVQAATASAPTYVKGGMYFDTTLNKLCIGGATAWETVTSA